MDALKLAQLMCSRLCHDLITPVGAISTGLEIIEESSHDIDPELLTLTSQSAHNASHRLVYYRAAFGYSASSILNCPEKLEKLLRDYLSTYKITLKWDCKVPEANLGTLQDHARLLVNLVGIMIECAPYGGNFHISVSPLSKKNSLTFSLELTGDLVNFKTNNKQALLGELPEQDVTPHSVQSLLTHLLLNEKQAALSLDTISPSRLAFCLKTDQRNDQSYGSLF